MLGLPRKGDSNQLVFANTMNNIVKDYYPNKLFNAGLDALNLRRIVIHGLRHKHDTHLAEVGAPYLDIQNRLSHTSSSRDTTAKYYVHITDIIKL